MLIHRHLDWGPLLPFSRWWDQSLSLLAPDQLPTCPYGLMTILDEGRRMKGEGKDVKYPFLWGNNRNEGPRVPEAAWVLCVNTVRVTAPLQHEPLAHPFLLPYGAVPWSPSVHDLLPGFLCSYPGLGLILTATMGCNPTSSTSLFHLDGLLKY